MDSCTLTRSSVLTAGKDKLWKTNVYQQFCSSKVLKYVSSGVFWLVIIMEYFGDVVGYNMTCQFCGLFVDGGCR